MIIGKIPNFSEYRFKEKNNSFCFSPYSPSENIFKSLIKLNRGICKMCYKIQREKY